MSDNIFAEIYNKILGFFGQNAKDESKNTAVNRLRLVLMQDRTNLTPEIMHRMRTELIEVLSKYVELDKEALDLNFEQEGEQMALMLSIPVIRAKDEAEIEEALKKDDEAKKSKENSEDEVDTDEEKSDESDTEETTKEDEIAEEKSDESDETPKTKKTKTENSQKESEPEQNEDSEDISVDDENISNTEKNKKAEKSSEE